MSQDETEVATVTVNSGSSTATFQMNALASSVAREGNAISAGPTFSITNAEGVPSDIASEATVCIQRAAINTNASTDLSQGHCIGSYGTEGGFNCLPQNPATTRDTVCGATSSLNERGFSVLAQAAPPPTPTPSPGSSPTGTASPGAPGDQGAGSQMVFHVLTALVLLIAGWML